MFSTLLVSLAMMSTTGWAQSYILQDDYMRDGNFFDMFSFFTDADPTNGFVDYVDQSTAQSGGFINSTSTQAIMGVDSTNVTPNGRPSVRLTSNKSYNEGLVIVDLEHMPGGICGTWPAFWMTGPNWPAGGEIDIIEGVNEQTINEMTLHTSDDCSISSTDASFLGSIKTDNCYVDASGQDANAGCQIASSNSQTYGSGFNAANGGVYATLWTGSAISIYFFPRGSVPSDITNGSPTPSSWGTPTALFQGSCDIPNHFKDLNIVFDTTFCGDWAGNDWSSGSCASKAATCNDYVQNNPSAFADAYWAVNSLKVYTNSGYISEVATTESASYSAAISTAAATSVSVDATSNAVVTPTTFAFSTKSSITLSASATNSPVAPNGTASYSVANATANFPTGSGTASLGAVLSTAAVASSMAPVSPPESVTSLSSAMAITTSFTRPTQTDEPWNWHEHGGSWHHTQETGHRAARHLRQHKRHAAGRF